jgi:hypothetical protein
VSGGGSVSGRGFQVVLSDLQSLAAVFRHESAALEGIMPGDGPPCPDAGGADVDAAMRATVQLLGLLHQQLAVVIGEHGRKLQAAYDNYEHTETSLARMADQLRISGTV